MSRFTDHPQSVGETYFQHMGVAFSFGWIMLTTGLACFVHGFFPFLFTTRGREKIEELHCRVVTNRHLECKDAAEKAAASHVAAAE